MARTKSVTSRVIDLDGFRSIVGYMDDTDEWIASVGERENVFEKMRNDGRVESLIEDRKNKVLQMYGSLTATGNTAVDKACEKYLTFNIFYSLNNILLNAVPYGIALCENLWTFRDGLYIPTGFVPIPRKAVSFPQREDLAYGTPVVTSQSIVLDDPVKFTVHRNDDGELSVWGRPALRAAYTFWKFKQLGVRFWASAAKKVGAPTILAVFETKTDEEAKKRAKLLTEALSDWEGGSSGALGNVKDIKIVSSQINDFNTIVNTCNAEIAYALTAQSLTTNQSEYGTKAQGEVHGKTYEDIIKGDAYKLQQADQKLVDAFVSLNFPGADTPVYDIDSTDFADWATIREAIDRGVPVSLSALYDKVHLPKPKKVAGDSFVKPQNVPAFSDDFFFRN